MNQKSFDAIVGSIFSVITALHLLRIVYGWNAVIGGWTVPLWLSWAAVILGVFFAYHAFRLSKANYLGFRFGFPAPLGISAVY